MNLILDKIIKNSQDQNFEKVSVNLDKFLIPPQKYNLAELIILQKKVNTALGILSTQKALLLDELTLINKSKKAFVNYD